MSSVMMRRLLSILSSQQFVSVCMDSRPWLTAIAQRVLLPLYIAAVSSRDLVDLCGTWQDAIAGSYRACFGALEIPITWNDVVPVVRIAGLSHKYGLHFYTYSLSLSAVPSSSVSNQRVKNYYCSAYPVPTRHCYF